MPSNSTNPPNAPYSGGVSPGASLFAVDGDFTVAEPSGAPEISFPFEGDSEPNFMPIILLDDTGTFRIVQRSSNGFNVQPFAANQTAVILEQKFVVAQAYYQPMLLNTSYDVQWSIGWQLSYAGVASSSLNNCFLVKEGPLENIGGGLVEFKRTFASLPPTRNETESYSASFPSFTAEISAGPPVLTFPTRPEFSTICSSRVQLDFFVYDDVQLLSIPIFDGHGNGRRLDTSTGLFPDGLMLPEQKYYKANPPDSTIQSWSLSMFLDSGEPLTDGDTPTNPSATTYLGWIGTAEIVAEASSFNRWLGNIYVRKTRFVVAQ